MNSKFDEIRSFNRELILEEWKLRFENEPDPNLKEKYQYDYEIMKKHYYDDEIDFSDKEVQQSIKRIDEYVSKSSEVTKERFEECKQQFELAAKEHEERKEEPAVLVRSREEMGCRSWLIHSAAVFFGLLGIWAIVSSMVDSNLNIAISTSYKEIPILISAVLLVVFGISPFINYRITLTSLAMIFFVGALHGIFTGEIKICPRCLTIYKDASPHEFYFWVSSFFSISVAGVFWAWRVKPTPHNKKIKPKVE